MRKLVYTAALTAAMFVAAFAASFLAMGVALAQPEPQPVPPPTEPVEVPPAGQNVPATPAPGDEAALGTAHAASGDAVVPPAVHHDPSKHFNFFGSPAEHYGKDVMGGKYGDGVMVDPHTGETTAGEEPMSAPFIWLVVNFALLLGLLAWKGGPLARKAAADRHDQIKTALDEAAKLRKLAADKLAEYETRLKDADTEIKKLVDGMRADAEADKARILENAARQAAQMKKDSDTRIAAEIEYARAALTREVTAAAMAATEKLLREKMMPVDQQKQIATFIGDIQKVAGKEVR